MLLPSYRLGNEEMTTEQKKTENPDGCESVDEPNKNKGVAKTADCDDTDPEVLS